MKIRIGFVANSSSQHSITFSSKFFINDLLRPNIKYEKKYIYKYEDSGYYSIGGQIYYSVVNKIDYIMLELLYKYDFSFNKIIKSKELNKLKKTIKKYCNIDFELYVENHEYIDCEGLIDHESVGTIFKFDLFNNHKLPLFLFDNKSSLNIFSGEDPEYIKKKMKFNDIRMKKIIKNEEKLLKKLKETKKEKIINKNFYS